MARFSQRSVADRLRLCLRDLVRKGIPPRRSASCRPRSIWLALHVYAVPHDLAVGIGVGALARAAVLVDQLDVSAAGCSRPLSPDDVCILDLEPSA